jgi:predicted DNA-binding protein (MmcQ/YjbR family)
MPASPCRLVITPLEQLRALCLALPEAFEQETWERPTFRVGGKGKILCMAAPDGTSATMKADPDEREALLAEGDRFYVPPYVGSKGWVGVYLDRRTDWDEVAELIATSYCLLAPKRLAGQVTEPPSPAGD